MAETKNGFSEEPEVENLDKLSYEEAVAYLEKVVKKLEAGDISLDESLRLFQKGMELSNICHNKLDEIEKKITQLVARDDGEIEEIPFGEENS